MVCLLNCNVCIICWITLLWQAIQQSLIYWFEHVDSKCCHMLIALVCT